MSDAPERIWINKVHGLHPEDWDFTDGAHLTKAQLRQKVEYVRADRIEAITEQLAAAQQDAEEAEAYAEKLEAKLAVVSHNATAFGHKIVSLESARDKAWKTCLDATTKGMELEAKLAIAVNTLEDVNTFGDCGLQHIVRPALAKIKGEQP